MATRLSERYEPLDGWEDLGDSVSEIESKHDVPYEPFHVIAPIQNWRMVTLPYASKSDFVNHFVLAGGHFFTSFTPSPIDNPQMGPWMHQKDATVEIQQIHESAFFIFMRPKSAFSLRDDSDVRLITILAGWELSGECIELINHGHLADDVDLSELDKKLEAEAELDTPLSDVAEKAGQILNFSCLFPGKTVTLQTDKPVKTLDCYRWKKGDRVAHLKKRARDSSREYTTLVNFSEINITSPLSAEVHVTHEAILRG